jgi:hypothetical protein
MTFFGAIKVENKYRGIDSRHILLILFNKQERDSGKSMMKSYLLRMKGQE